MAGFDGSGNYVRYYSWVQDASNNINITASRVDTEDNGYATGLSLCVTRDGQGKMVADFLPATSASFNLGTGVKRWLSINALSGTIGPPGSVLAALSITGIANANAQIITSPNTAGASYGLAIVAGTNASDYSANFSNAAGTALWTIFGDGGIIAGAPTGGDKGLGTLNVGAGYYINGNPIYVGIPQNSQSSAYTTVLADANKHIYHPSADTTARTWTIDSNANVAYPIGTAITFDNDGSAGIITLAITADTLVWLPSGGTGSRSIAPFGQGTALKVTATRWHLTGVGIT